jgi:hypothetical protein
LPIVDFRFPIFKAQYLACLSLRAKARASTRPPHHESIAKLAIGNWQLAIGNV